MCSVYFYFVQTNCFQLPIINVPGNVQLNDNAKYQKDSPLSAEVHIEKEFHKMAPRYILNKDLKTFNKVADLKVHFITTTITIG